MAVPLPPDPDPPPSALPTAPHHATAMAPGLSSSPATASTLATSDAPAGAMAVDLADPFVNADTMMTKVPHAAPSPPSLSCRGTGLGADTATTSTLDPKGPTPVPGAAMEVEADIASLPRSLALPLPALRRPGRARP